MPTEWYKVVVQVRGQKEHERMKIDTKWILETVGQWASGVGQSGAAGRVYVFGSLINQDGDAFNAQESDVDILCLFRDEDATAAKSRYEACRLLRSMVPKLELNLLLAIKRYDAKKPISSINLLSPWEATKCVHKDGVRKLFYMKQFRSVHPVGDSMEQLATFIDDEFHASYESIVMLFRYLQTLRNQFLKANLHGEDFFSVSTGSDPVPKTVMRLAAACAAFERDPSGRPDDLESIDPLEGIEWLTVLLNECRRSGDEDINKLRRWMAAARRARASDAPMSRDQLLLLAELLYDRARIPVRWTAVDKMDAAIARSGG